MCHVSCPCSVCNDGYKSSSTRSSQVLRSSGALELSVQGCLAEPGNAGAAAALQSLLRSFASPPLDVTRALSVATAVDKWSGLLSAEQRPPPELLTAAQQAISAVLASILAAPTVADASAATAGKQQGADAQAAIAAARTAADVAMAAKDAAVTRRRLLQLTERQLAGGSADQDPSAAAATAAADTAALVTFTEQRVRVWHRAMLSVKSCCCKRKGRIKGALGLAADQTLHWLLLQALQLMTAGGASGGSKHSAALDAYKSEDAALAAQVTMQLEDPLSTIKTLCSLWTPVCA